jgi:hypothetical protein
MSQNAVVHAAEIAVHRRVSFRHSVINIGNFVNVTT